MESYRDRYFKNYTAERRPSQNRRGFSVVYVYTGDWYSWKLSEAQLRRRKTLYLLGLLVQLGAFLTAAVSSDPVNACPYVAVPGLLALAAFLFEAIGILQFCLQKRQFTVISYRGTHQRICLASLMGAVGGGLAAGGCLACCLRTSSPLPVGIFCGYLVSCAVCGAIFRGQKKLDVSIKPGKNGQPLG